MNNKLIYIVALGALVGVQPVFALDLRDSVLAALSRVEEAKIGAIQLKQSKIQVESAEADFYPTLSVRLRTGPEYNDPGFNEGESEDLYYANSLQTNITQPLLDGQSREFTLESRKLSLKSLEHQVKSVLERVSFDVVTSYLNVVYQQEVVNTLQRNLRTLKTIELQVNRQTQAGTLSAADEQQVRARVVGAEATLSRALLTLSEVEFAYTKLVGPIENDMVVPFDVPDFHFEEYSVVSDSVQINNTGLKQATYNRLGSLADLNVAKAARWPVMNLEGRTQYSSTLVGGSGEVINAGIYLNINYNYSFGGSIGLAIDRAEERSKELALLKQLLNRDTETSLQTQYSNYQSFKNVIDSIKREIIANELVLNAQEEQQKLGTGRVIDLVNAQERLNDARIRLLNNQRDSQLNRYQLLQTMGQLLEFFEV